MNSYEDLRSRLNFVLEGNSPQRSTVLARMEADKIEVDSKINVSIVVIVPEADDLPLSPGAPYTYLKMGGWIDTPIDMPNKEWHLISGADAVILTIDSLLRDEQEQYTVKLHAVVDILFFLQTENLSSAATNKQTLSNWLSVDQEKLQFFTEISQISDRLAEPNNQKIRREIKFLQKQVECDRGIEEAFWMWNRLYNEMERDLQKEIEGCLRKIGSEMPSDQPSRSCKVYSHSFGYTPPVVREWLYNMKPEDPLFEEKFEEFIDALVNQWTNFITQISEKFVDQLGQFIDKVIDTLASSWEFKLEFPPRADVESSHYRFEGEMIVVNLKLSKLRAVRDSLLDSLYSALFAGYIGKTVAAEVAAKAAGTAAAGTAAAGTAAAGTAAAGTTAAGTAAAGTAAAGTGPLAVAAIVAVGIMALLAWNGTRNKLHSARTERHAQVQNELNHFVYEVSQQMVHDFNEAFRKIREVVLTALQETKEEVEKQVKLMKYYPEFSKDIPDKLKEYDVVLLELSAVNGNG